MSLKLLQERSGILDDGIFGKNTFRECSKTLGITDHSSAVHFWAQVAHETGMFRLFEENLNYSSKGLLAVFGKYFKDYESTVPYARKPEKIANKVYANRMGNGDESSGDGWKYRGRGALQLTGKNNYQSFCNYIGDTVFEDILCNPDLVKTKYAFESAIFFFDKNKLWDISCKDTSKDTVKKLTRRINGGFNGLEHRLELTQKYSKYSL